MKGCNREFFHAGGPFGSEREEVNSVPADSVNKESHAGGLALVGT